MRYGNQQLSEIESWPVGELVRYYEHIYKLVETEFHLKAQSGGL